MMKDILRVKVNGMKVDKSTDEIEIDKFVYRLQSNLLKY